MDTVVRFSRSARIGVLLVVVGTAIGASAQTTPNPVAAPANAAYVALQGVAKLGKTWNEAAFAETLRLYTEAHRQLSWPGVLEPETVQYGADPQQTLRLFRPEQGFSEPGPVIVFLPGQRIRGQRPDRTGQ